MEDGDLESLHVEGDPPEQRDDNDAGGNEAPSYTTSCTISKQSATERNPNWPRWPATRSRQTGGSIEHTHLESIESDIGNGYSLAT